MAPKKLKKISLNEFLGDSALGSWADEMDSLPNAPAARTDEEQGDRFGRRDDFLSSRPDRQQGPPREDVPLPTQPPFTAFVGNLAFDLTETELGGFFTGFKIKTVKIIKDKDEKPKGFGYVEFEELEGLKEALMKSGSSFSGRVIRVSVAEPPKERSGFGGLSEDNSKFDNPWRRDGPPPTRDSSRRRVDGPAPERQPSSVADDLNDWRSSRPQRASEPDVPQFKRKGSGFLAPETQVGTADKEDAWVIGSKFKPSSSASNEETPNKFGSGRMKSDIAPPKELPREDADWRSAARPRPARSSVSPSNSAPPTPQMGRRKLELLPRTGNASVTPSPVSSPKMVSTPTSGGARANPFGAAKPVDVTSREKEVAERLEREKEEKPTMSRTSSRTGVDRNPSNRSHTPPTSSPNVPSKPPSSKFAVPNLAPTVRPTLSFASAAAKKDSSGQKNDETSASDAREVSEDVAKVALQTEAVRE